MDHLTLIPVTDASGALIEPDKLLAAAPIHRQLRPMLPERPDAYVAKMRRVFAGGARMIVAFSGDEVVGLALYRVYENTYENNRLYVDDLVTDEQQRSKGVGAALLAWCENEAKAQGCEWIALDSASWRSAAHRFYFHKNFAISSFHFVKRLENE